MSQSGQGLSPMPLSISAPLTPTSCIDDSMQKSLTLHRFHPFRWPGHSMSACDQRARGSTIAHLGYRYHFYQPVFSIRALPSSSSLTRRLFRRILGEKFGPRGVPECGHLLAMIDTASKFACGRVGALLPLIKIQIYYIPPLHRYTSLYHRGHGPAD